MKFNFVQKKGVVVALAAALSVGAFGVTALAGISFNGPTPAQSVYFQSHQSEWGLFDTGEKSTSIELTKGSPSRVLDLSVIDKFNQSEGWTFTQTSGTDVVSYTGEMPDFTITAHKDGTAIFKLCKGSDVLTITVTASGWSTGGGYTPSYGGGGGAVATKPDKGTETTKATISKEADGTMKLVDADGKAVVNAKVTVDGKSYVSDADGKVITNAIATTPKGNKVVCGADGAIVKNKTVVVNGKKYLASKSGKIVTSKIAKTPKGNFVYCTKSGAIKTNGIFKVDGKKYIAKKSGALYTNRWVTIGNTKYFCNKSGVVTKTKTLK